ncbi:hypothetical protein H257_17405 [Aphanomyces astaci]|uniref:Uncharacterized protein n=1 Tax=Aphanomyces astaci TaxID=112090 RepID=W4FGL6_APHAT|nr:hypothetical protein H257_17405 [Aphanomyces astaci]ETV65986.1 hypothetical protein H257_17405 [Aphanomyces astaci]|eukprot:XP_009844505.1 hypothetical protein H257_17405 [Aphanomyces astaci]
MCVPLHAVDTTMDNVPPVPALPTVLVSAPPTVPAPPPVPVPALPTALRGAMDVQNAFALPTSEDIDATIAETDKVSNSTVPKLLPKTEHQANVRLPESAFAVLPCSLTLKGLHPPQWIKASEEWALLDSKSDIHHKPAQRFARHVVDDMLEERAGYAENFKSYETKLHACETKRQAVFDDFSNRNDDVRKLHDKLKERDEQIEQLNGK